MDVDGPRRGSRDNGLRAGNYAAIGDLDPRVVDVLLGTLRDRGIAAYAVPSQGSVGGALEMRVPSRPLDRLFVDDQQVDKAREVVDAESALHTPERIPATQEPEFEASWQQVLASLQSNPTHLETPWPERENLTLEEREAAYDEAEAAAADPDDEHFTPPAPPPLPRLRPATYGALATMALCVAVMLSDIGGRGLQVLAFLVFVAAAGSLVYNMRQGPPSDSDDDDGAVV